MKQSKIVSEYKHINKVLKWVLPFSYSNTILVHCNQIFDAQTLVKKYDKDSYLLPNSFVSTLNLNLSRQFVFLKKRRIVFKMDNLSTIAQWFNSFKQIDHQQWTQIEIAVRYKHSNDITAKKIVQTKMEKGVTTA